MPMKLIKLTLVALSIAAIALAGSFSATFVANSDPTESSETFSKKVSIVDIPGKELLFIINLDDHGAFSEYFRFQYDEGDATFLNGKKGFFIASAEENRLLIKTSMGSTMVFSMNDESILPGYGLGRHWGRYNLDLQRYNPIVSLKSGSTPSPLLEPGQQKAVLYPFD